MIFKHILLYEYTKLTDQCLSTFSNLCYFLVRYILGCTEHGSTFDNVTVAQLTLLMFSNIKDHTFL